MAITYIYIYNILFFKCPYYILTKGVFNGYPCLSHFQVLCIRPFNMAIKLGMNGISNRIQWGLYPETIATV